MSIDRRGSPGGLFSDRPGRTLRLFGVLPVDRDAGLSLVYSAAIAGWTYLLRVGCPPCARARSRTTDRRRDRSRSRD